MYEFLLDALPESALACRRLYDVRTGGYHLPLREHNVFLRLSEVERTRAEFPKVVFDCIETPVADLLYSLVVNTKSRWILETGTSRGFSTAHLAAGARFVDAKAARVLTIDPAPAPNPFFADGGVHPSITAVRADSLSIDLRPLLGDDRFDFMFFDSLHTYAHLCGELARYLPHLKAGGLFALHDTLVYDDLGLVVIALAASGAVEVVTLPTHRSHREGARSPGVTLFRKIRRIEVGDLVFPDLEGVVDGERQSVTQPALIVKRTGSLFTDPRYATSGLHRNGPRDDDSPALLECVEALRERETPAPGTWLDRLAGFTRLHAAAASAEPLPLRRHPTLAAAEAQLQDAWWRAFGPLEQRFHRLLPEPFAPASQRRLMARLLAACEGADEIVHFVCDAATGSATLQAAIDVSVPPRRLTVRPLGPDAWRLGQGELPSAGAYLLHGVLEYLSSTEITALLTRLQTAAPAGARIVVIEPVCFPDHRPDERDRALASAIANLVQAPTRAGHRDGVVFSAATRDTRAQLARRWWGELPCGPAPLQRPFDADELTQRLAQVFDVTGAEILQVSSAAELGLELLLLADDDAPLALRLTADLMPALDEVEASLLARVPLPDVSWYLSMSVAVARGAAHPGR